MKKIFGVILIIVGLATIPKVITTSTPETIGGIIGVSLFTFLPAYLLLKNKKKD